MADQRSLVRALAKISRLIIYPLKSLISEHTIFVLLEIVGNSLEENLMAQSRTQHANDAAAFKITIVAFCQYNIT